MTSRADRTPLVHIGHHKTGSTWLQRLIFSDESLGFTQVRPRTIIDEAFVVCNPFTFDPDTSHAYFEEWFDKADANGHDLVISHERLTGLPLMNAVDGKDIADRITDTYPKAKVVIVIREQRSMMLSIYKQYILRMGKDSYDHVWRERTIRERRRPGPSLDVYEYHHLIRYYMDKVGKENVLVLPFEKLRNDNVGFVDDIMRFLGRTGPATVPEDPENVALPAAAVATVRYVNKVMRMVGFGTTFAGPIADRRSRRVRLVILRALGPTLPKSWSKRVEQKWKDKTMELAAGRFAQSNKITSELTGLDLASYGYDV